MKINTDDTYTTINGIGSSQDTTAGIQLGVDSCLGDRHTTLLHHFMDCCAVNVRHLVKLVDADYAAIGEHHCAGLQPTISCNVTQQ